MKEVEVGGVVAVPGLSTGEGELEGWSGGVGGGRETEEGGESHRPGNTEPRPRRSWKGNGASFASGVNVGSGWAAFRQFTSMDVNGDNRADLVAIRAADDTLWRWLGTGTDTFGQGVQAGNGWANHQLTAY